ncbi:MAG: PAS domain-containing protein [Thermodesulfobacteriota bacterium]
MEFNSQDRALRGNFMLLGAIGALAFWVAETLLHAVAFDGAGALDALIPGDPNELWMRSVTALVFVLFGLSAERAIRRRERAEAELGESRARYRSLAESARDSIYIVERDFTVSYVNPYGARFLGREAGEVVGSSLVDLFGPRTFAHMEKNLESVFDGAVSMTVEGRFVVDDREVWLDTSLVPMTDKSGRVRSVMGLSRDITEKKRMETNLREQRDLAQKYMSVAGVILVLVEPSGKVALVNRKGSEILGLDEEEIKGKDWFDNFLPPPVRERARAVFAGVVSGKLRYAEYCESPVLAAGGEERLIAWHNTVITGDDGAVTGCLSSGADITERRRMEDDLRARLDELERFRKATVAREFRVKELKERLKKLEGEGPGHARRA